MTTERFNGHTETALELLKCTQHWKPEVCLMGNVTSSRIAELCRTYLQIKYAGAMNKVLSERTDALLKAAKDAVYAINKSEYLTDETTAALEALETAIKLAESTLGEGE